MVLSMSFLSFLCISMFVQAFPTSICLILASSFVVVVVVSSPFSFVTCEPTSLKVGLFFVVPVGLWP